jgi:hypothetical protein
MALAAMSSEGSSDSDSGGGAGALVGGGAATAGFAPDVLFVAVDEIGFGGGGAG